MCLLQSNVYYCSFHETGLGWDLLWFQPVSRCRGSSPFDLQIREHLPASQRQDPCWAGFSEEEDTAQQVGFPLTICVGIPGLRESDWDSTAPENLARAASPFPEALTISVSLGVEEAGCRSGRGEFKGAPISWGPLRAPMGSTPGQSLGWRSPAFQTPSHRQNGHFLPSSASQPDTALPSLVDFQLSQGLVFSDTNLLSWEKWS